MAYTWTDGELITAEKLNNTGGGVLIVNANYDESTQVDTLDKTWQEINAAFPNNTVLIKIVDENFNISKYLPVFRVNTDNEHYYVSAFVYDAPDFGSAILYYSADSADAFPNSGDPGATGGGK